MACLPDFGVAALSAGADGHLQLPMRATRASEAAESLAQCLQWRAWQLGLWLRCA